MKCWAIYIVGYAIGFWNGHNIAKYGTKNLKLWWKYFFPCLIVLMLGLGGCTRNSNYDFHGARVGTLFLKLEDGGKIWYFDVPVSSSGVIRLPQPTEIEYNCSSVRKLP